MNKPEDVFDFWSKTFSEQEFEVLNRLAQKEIVNSTWKHKHILELIAQRSRLPNFEIHIGSRNAKDESVTKNKTKNFKYFRLIGHHKTLEFAMTMYSQESKRSELKELFNDFDDLVLETFKDYFAHLSFDPAQHKIETIKDLYKKFNFSLGGAKLIYDINF